MKYRVAFTFRNEDEELIRDYLDNNGAGFSGTDARKIANDIRSGGLYTIDVLIEPMDNDEYGLDAVKSFGRYKIAEYDGFKNTWSRSEAIKDIMENKISNIEGLMRLCKNGLITPTEAITKIASI